jgi:hypothetical protein
MSARISSSPVSTILCQPCGSDYRSIKDGVFKCSFYKLDLIFDEKYCECDYSCDKYNHSGDCSEECFLEHEHCPLKVYDSICGELLGEHEHCGYIHVHGNEPCSSIKNDYHVHCPYCGDEIQETGDCLNNDCDNYNNPFE